MIAVYLLGGALSAVSVRAGGLLTIVEKATVDPAGINYPAPVLLSIPQFDPAKGTLVFAVVRITANFDAMLLAENLGSSSAFITGSATETIEVTPPPFIYPVPLTDMAKIPPTSEPVTASDGVDAFGGTDTATFSLTPNPKSVVLATLMFNDMDAGFGDFIGNGFLPDFEVNAFGNWAVSSNSTGAVLAKANLLVGADIQVEYHYVPEPATACLVLPVLLVACRRRRHR